MRRKATVLAALALCVSLCTAVGAAEPEETGQLEEGEWKAQPLQQGEITSPPPVELLPVEVIASEDDIAYRLEKIYELGAEEDPAQIPTEGFEREGHKYVFLDLLKEDRRETDTKEHTEVVTRNTKVKDTEAILKELPATVEYNGEDGYTGILILDTSSVQVEAAGYGSRSYDVSATRTQPIGCRYLPDPQDRGGEWEHTAAGGHRLADSSSRSDDWAGSGHAVHSGSYLYRQGQQPVCHRPCGDGKLYGGCKQDHQ